jgi:hypothetical protein
MDSHFLSPLFILTLLPSNSNQHLTEDIYANLNKKFRVTQCKIYFYFQLAYY